MSSLAVGKEIISHCNRCKLSLAHVIVVMSASEKPYKVQCKTCQSTHIHRGEKSVAKATATRKTKKKKLTGKKAKAASNQQSWQEAVDGTKDQDTFDYSPKKEYQLGDVINHPTFGQGLIDKLIDGNKIEVIFQADVKTLMHKLGR